MMNQNIIFETNCAKTECALSAVNGSSLQPLRVFPDNKRLAKGAGSFLLCEEIEMCAGNMENTLQEGIDYYLEGGLMVFTCQYHLKRGACCGSKCRHCPYEPRWAKGTRKISQIGKKMAGKQDD
jgi:hypothetical protein